MRLGISKYILNNCKIISNIGIEHYKSPQMIKNIEYSHKTDIWSAGVICYEIANKRYPFANFEEEINDIDLENKINERIKTGKYYDFNSDIRGNIKNIIEMMLIIDEDERLDIDELLKILTSIKLNNKLPLNEIK